MEDGKIAITNKIEDIQINLKSANYSVCSKISHNLVNFACNLELEEETFISEILENVFSNLIDLYNYEIPKEVKEKINLDISEKIRFIAEAYNAKDPNQLYERLKQLRYITTQHQLNVWQNYDVSSKLPRHMMKWKEE